MRLLNQRPQERFASCRLGFGAGSPELGRRSSPSSSSSYVDAHDSARSGRCRGIRRGARQDHHRRPRPLTKRIELRDYDPARPLWYDREQARIRSILGDRVICIEHIGSTPVPGLAAKPILDIALEVPNSADEPAYLPDLEAAGYVLPIREPEWFEHRLFQRGRTTPPRNASWPRASGSTVSGTRTPRLRSSGRSSRAQRPRRVSSPATSA